MSPDSKETERGSSDQVLHQQMKRHDSCIRTILCMEVCPNSHIRCCEYSRGSSVSFVLSDEFKRRATKITSENKCLIHSQSTFLLLPYFLNKIAIVSKVHNQVTLNYTSP